MVAISTSSRAADQRPSFGKAAAFTAAAFFVKTAVLREAVWSLHHGLLRGRLIRQIIQAGHAVDPCFVGSTSRLPDTKTAKIVVRMQHPLTTSSETVRTPKKAADD
jgi:hypothetical protein